MREFVQLTADDGVLSLSRVTATVSHSPLNPFTMADQAEDLQREIFGGSDDEDLSSDDGAL